MCTHTSTYNAYRDIHRHTQTHTHKRLSQVHTHTSTHNTYRHTHIIELVKDFTHRNGRSMGMNADKRGETRMKGGERRQR